MGVTEQESYKQLEGNIDKTDCDSDCENIPEDDPDVEIMNRTMTESYLLSKNLLMNGKWKTWFH